MTGNDYLRIWYRVQIGATLVILAMMMIRNYEFNRQTVALALLIMVIILGIGLVFELLPNVSLLVKKLNAWLQVIAQPIILVFAWDVMVREIIVLLHLPSRGVVTMMIFYYFIMFAPFASVIGEFMHWSIERLIFIAWLAQVRQHICGCIGRDTFRHPYIDYKCRCCRCLSYQLFYMVDYI